MRYIRSLLGSRAVNWKNFTIRVLNKSPTGSHRFEKEGLEGLRDKKGRGSTPRLNDDKRKRIGTLLNESLEEYGYNSATWTGPMLIEWIGKNFSIIYKKAQIYNVIKSLGYSYQKGRGIFPETDEQEQAVFKEALKKTI